MLVAAGRESSPLPEVAVLAFDHVPVLGVGGIERDGSVAA